MPISVWRRILEAVLFIFASVLMTNQGFAFSEEWKWYDVLNFPTGFCEKISITDDSRLSGADRAFFENIRNGCKKDADAIPLDGDLRELMDQSLQIQDPMLFELAWMLLPRNWQERNEFVKILAEDDQRMKRAVDEKLSSSGGVLWQFIKISLNRDIFDLYARSGESLDAAWVQAHKDYMVSLEDWQMNDTILSTIIDTWYYSTVSLSGFVLDASILEKDRMHPSKETVKRISDNIMIAWKDGFSIKYVWYEKNALVALWKSDKESFQEALTELMRLRPQWSIAFFSRSFFAGFEKNPSFITDSKEFTEQYKNLASSLSKFYNDNFRRANKDSLDEVLGELETFLKALGEYPKDSLNLKAKTGFSFFGPAVRAFENCLLVDNNKTMELLQKYDGIVRSFPVLRDAGSRPPKDSDGSWSVNNAASWESSLDLGQKWYGYIVWGIFLLIILLIIIYAKRKNI